MVARASTPLLVVLATAGLVFVLLFAPQARAQSVPGVTVHIEITSTGFVPQVIEVQSGWAVQWTNNSSVNHVVTSSDDDADFVFDTGLLEPGESGAFVFDLEGSFEYFSVTEPTFSGTVIVGGAAAPTPVAPTATATNPPAATATSTSVPSNTATPTATTPASSPTPAPTEPTSELPSTQVPSETATPQPTATAEATATAIAAQPTPPPPAAGGAGLYAIGGGSTAMSVVLLGMAVMALAAASLLYSGSLGRIGIESPRSRRK